MNHRFHLTTRPKLQNPLSSTVVPRGVKLAVKMQSVQLV